MSNALKIAAGMMGGGSSNDPLFSNVQLLMHFDAANGSTTFTDVKGKTITAFGNAQHTTTDPLTGTASYLGDGVGDYLKAGVESDWYFIHRQTEDYTIEWTMKVNNFADFNTVLFYGNDSGGVSPVYYLRLNQTTGVLGAITYSSNAAHVVSVMTTAGDIVAGQKHQCAHTYEHATRTHRLFVDGVLKGSGVKPVDFPSNQSPNMLVIGAYGDGSGNAFSFNGRLDELRITKGECLYTANYTPRSTAFPDA